MNDSGPDPRRTGSIYGFADLDTAQARVTAPGRWTTLEIRAVGQTYTVYRDGVRINLQLSQQQLGNMVGMSRESMNKHLRQWREEDLIRRALVVGIVIVAKAGKQWHVANVAGRLRRA